MLIAVLISASLILALTSLHALAARYFSVSIVNGKRPVNPAFQPRTAILMSIRGCDPSLEKNLVGLMNQEYDDFEIVAIVDDQSDEAWSIVHHIKSEFDTENRLRIIELTQPSNSCSLKCSALVQGVRSLSDDVEAIVLVDADVVPHREWLSQAISPLADSQVGVVTGNQWFEPQNRSTGSMLRSLWNAGALVPTAALANPWAGTCAMRLEDVKRSGLIEVWKKSMVDDGPIRKALAPLNKDIVFNPELIMVNRENCTIDYVNRYVPRMLMWSRMHESTFIHTFLHMVMLVGSFVATVLLTLAGVVLGQWIVVGVGLSALLIAVALNLVAYMTVRDGIRRIESRRDEVQHQHYLSHLNPGRIAKLALLIPVCLVGFGVWTVRSVFARRIAWRQITYEVHGHDRVRMLDYRPMNIEPDVRASEVSI